MSKNNPTDKKEIVNVTLLNENQKTSGLTQYKKIANPLDPEFQEPKRYGDYTRIEEGDNIIRILSQEGIFGCEYWTEEFDTASGKIKKKPVRRRLEEVNTIETLDWSYFYAFFIWNYKAERVQIFCTSKRGIVKGLTQQAKKVDKWGKITDYDICINRTQTNPSDSMSVEYSVIPEPPTGELKPEIKDKWESLNFNQESLCLLFDNLDPFAERLKALEAAKEEAKKAPQQQGKRNY